MAYLHVKLDILKKNDQNRSSRTAGRTGQSLW